MQYDMLPPPPVFDLLFCSRPLSKHSRTEHGFEKYFFSRYKILAPNAIPTGFIDGKVAVEKLIEALQLEQSEYRVGTTKVFFKAGIVGELEDMRDERLSKIIAQFQAYCKGFLMRKEYKKMCDQR